MDKRSITSASNGKLGGRPVSSKTLLTQSMREELIIAVHKQFKDIYEPQLEKALKGDFAAYKDLMDRVGLKGDEFQTPIVPVQVNNYILEDREKYSQWSTEGL